MMNTTFSYNNYWQYEQLTANLRLLADRYPGLSKLESLAKTPEGRDIWAMTITDPSVEAPLVTMKLVQADAAPYATAAVAARINRSFFIVFQVLTPKILKRTDGSKPELRMIQQNCPIP